MHKNGAAIDTAVLDGFVRLIGRDVWNERIAALRGLRARSRGGRALAARHCLELAIERQRRQPRAGASAAEIRIAGLAAEAVGLSEQLSSRGKLRLRSTLLATFASQDSLIPVFHVLQTAALQRSRGFEVEYAGWESGARFDLLISRDGAEAEVACDVLSAEEGHGVHHGAWFRLMDRIDPELQVWLSAHPGRYLLKMTLPQGLRGSSELPEVALASLHRRISAMLSSARRADHDEAAVLRLDPLLLAGAQAEELGLMGSLRRDFGPEAHLSVVAAEGGVFVLAARGGQENDVAVAVRHRLAAIAPARLGGTRPGILAIFVEDTPREEWRLLRERHELEAEARQFLTTAAARNVVAVTCTSRHEMFGGTAPDAAAEGELRFRNQGHPAAKVVALAPAVLSSL